MADRDASGRFKPGNRCAKGNPYAKRAAELRSALYRAATVEDLSAVIRTMVGLAVAGDVQAAKLIIDRLLGPPLPLDILERIEQLEAAQHDADD